MRKNYDTLLTLLRTGASLEDLQYIAPLTEIQELRNAPEFLNEQGMNDWSKLNAYVCRKYYMSELSIWRAKKRLERELSFDD